MTKTHPAGTPVDVTQKALPAQSICFGNLVGKHIKETYPTGIVLVCSPDNENHMFEMDLLEAAFGPEATKDICSDLADICVIPFQGATVKEVRNALITAALEDGYDDEFAKNLGDMYTIYEDGEPILTTKEMLGTD